MSPVLDVLVLLLAMLASAAFSGSEIAFYLVSRARIDVESRQGVRRSIIVRRLLSEETALLVTVLIGNNLMTELMTWSAGDLLESRELPPWTVQAGLLLVLTPCVFFFAEMLPKDLFRRRPHALLQWTAPFVLAARYAFWPLERLLSLLIFLMTKALGFEPRLLSVVRGREAVLQLLSEGAREGAILPHAEQMARNVMKLRSIEVERCMVPWRSVRTIQGDLPEADLYAAVAASPHTRIPVVDAGGAAIGYVHQLDVLGEGEDVPVLAHLRPLTVLSSHTSVDRALARLRSAGQRLALVGSPEDPHGVVTLKDLLEEISGDLAGW